VKSKKKSKKVSSDSESDEPPPVKKKKKKADSDSDSSEDDKKRKKVDRDGRNVAFFQGSKSKGLAMSSAVAKVARPAVMRNFIAPVIKKHLVVATVLSVVTTYGYYAAVFKPRKEAYRKFYENYDPDKTYEQMKKTGIFQSVAQIAEAAAEAAEEAGEEEEE